MEDIHQKVEKGRWKRIYSNSLDSAVHCYAATFL